MNASFALSPRRVALGLDVAAAAVLLGALYAQVGLGIAPCVLCLAQRVPWVIVAVLAAMALQPAVPLRWARILLGICALALVVNAGIAGYHVGVEQHWWAGTAACGSGAGTAATGAGPATLADLKAALAGPIDAPPPCDEPGWTFMGISFAGLNFGLCLLLAGIAVSGARPRG
ncbi:disulfide bond formation protein B [Pararhodospirillum oryzae]|uniref:Disulfide bond formation protein DsbB n=1 Tax=Pararhodospirillum oryzae TaxID=478448 RepID=A0A512H6L0_9PROT|nr:disulfide bond formation protein B [Pararhodospirillum oryzae]GEO81072.1 disulfide bond formation protein DsbB [Pararhodospirillum oryzae]